MPVNAALIRGLIPVPQRDQKLRYERIDIAASGNTEDLFIGSVIQRTSGGEAIALPYTGVAADDGDDLMLGVIANIIKKSNGRSFTGIPKNKEGYECDFVPFDSDARFKARMSSTAFAGKADIGKYYNLTDETAVASEDPLSATADPASLRRLDGATENSSARHFIVTGYDDEDGRNIAALENTEVIVKANPSLVQPV